LNKLRPEALPTGVEEARWVSLEAAKTMLACASERKVVERVELRTRARHSANVTWWERG
jgi:hypothetical protein